MPETPLPEVIARFAAVLLSLAFAWAAVAKLSAYARWKAVLARYGLPASVRYVAGPLVPVIEIATAVTIVFISARAGAAAACVLLAAFSLAILRARSINGDRLPCGCFGGSEDRHYRTMLWRNASLALLAALVLQARGEVNVTLPSMPQGGEWVAAGLVVVGGLLAVWMAWQVSSAFRNREHP